jgi:hypothetical protein
MANQIWIDEVDLANFFQKEPTPAEVMARFGYWEPTANGKMLGIEVDSWEAANKDRIRQKQKERRRKEQENCLHGRRPYLIYWRPGTHPLGERQYYVNIDGMTGGPFLLTEEDHEILHNVKRGHEHVRTDLFKDVHTRKVREMLSP